MCLNNGKAHKSPYIDPDPLCVSIFYFLQLASMLVYMSNSLILMFQLERAKRVSRGIEEYRDLMKKGREHFRKELESIQPDVRIGRRVGEMIFSWIKSSFFSLTFCLVASVIYNIPSTYCLLVPLL